VPNHEATATACEDDRRDGKPMPEKAMPEVVPEYEVVVHHNAVSEHSVVSERDMISERCVVSERGVAHAHAAEGTTNESACVAHRASACVDHRTSASAHSSATTMCS